MTMLHQVAVQHLAAFLAAADAPSANAFNPPDPATLILALADSRFMRLARIERDTDGRAMLAFETAAPDGTMKTRRMPVIYAAITGLLEFGGAQVQLHKAPGGQRRTVFQLRLTIPSHGILTNLQRILFGVGKSQRIKEKLDANFRDIAPANYTRRIGYDREDVLAAMRPELASLLHLAFQIADRWHKADLINDPRR